MRDATLALLAEVGYQRLAMEQVAARAGVGKGALYRRWSSKAELVFAQVIHPIELPEPPDTGTLRGDLARIVDDLSETLSVGPASAAVSGLLADLVGRPDVRERFLDTFVRAERSSLLTIVERAVARGELAAVPDIEVLQSLLVGPLLAWVAIFGGRPSAGQLDALMSVVADGLTAVGR